MPDYEDDIFSPSTSEPRLSQPKASGGDEASKDKNEAESSVAVETDPNNVESMPIQLSTSQGDEAVEREDQGGDDSSVDASAGPTAANRDVREDEKEEGVPMDECETQPNLLWNDVVPVSQELLLKTFIRARTLDSKWLLFFPVGSSCYNFKPHLSTHV